MPRTAPRKKTARRKSRGRKTSPRKTTRYWSGRVTRESDTLDLDKGVFSSNDPKRIAASLKRSAERSRRRKSAPYRSGSESSAVGLLLKQLGNFNRFD